MNNKIVDPPRRSKRIAQRLEGNKDQGPGPSGVPTSIRPSERGTEGAAPSRLAPGPSGAPGPTRPDPRPLKLKRRFAPPPVAAPPQDRLPADSDHIAALESELAEAKALIETLKQQNANADLAVMRLRVGLTNAKAFRQAHLDRIAELEKALAATRLDAVESPTPEDDVVVIHEFADDAAAQAEADRLGLPRNFFRCHSRDRPVDIELSDSDDSNDSPLPLRNPRVHAAEGQEQEDQSDLGCFQRRYAQYRAPHRHKQGPDTS